MLLLVHDEAGVALFRIPLESGKVGRIKLVIGLCISDQQWIPDISGDGEAGYGAQQPSGTCGKGNDGERTESYLLLELLMNSV